MCVRRAIGKLKVSGAPNRHEPAAAARLPPTPLAKLLHGMSRVCLTHCSVHQPRRYVPWRLATADTTPASTARSSSGAGPPGEMEAMLANLIGARARRGLMEMRLRQTVGGSRDRRRASARGLGGPPLAAATPCARLTAGLASAGCAHTPRVT